MDGPYRINNHKKKKPKQSPDTASKARSDLLTYKCLLVGIYL